MALYSGLEMMKQEEQYRAIPKMGHISGSEYLMKNQYYETKAEDKDDQLRIQIKHFDDFVIPINLRCKERSLRRVADQANKRDTY
jgi:hypothetical protein